jgi:hypothetical protein
MCNCRHFPPQGAVSSCKNIKVEKLTIGVMTVLSAVKMKTNPRAEPKASRIYLPEKAV